MKTMYHNNMSRGQANFGWLTARYSFSFANYYNPDRIRYGVLRVLNDDIVAKGKGFGMHPHDNMEIITIPTSGQLEHKDSMGNSSIISSGEIQVMSAGTGVYHSEFNPNQDQDTRLFQIWLFPNKKNVSPRYDQLSLTDISGPNEFYQILSPNSDDQGVWIHQDAWFFMGDFDIDAKKSYTFKRKGNGAYIMVIEGSANIDNQELNKRDAMGVWDTESFDIAIKANSKILVMDIPMK